MRLAQAGVPNDLGGHLTKPEIALAEIDRGRTVGLRFGCMLTDAGYGLSAPCVARALISRVSSHSGAAGIG